MHASFEEALNTVDQDFDSWPYFCMGTYFPNENQGSKGDCINQYIAPEDKHLILLDRKPFFHQEKPFSSHLPFKKRFICSKEHKILKTKLPSNLVTPPTPPKDKSPSLNPPSNFITPKKVLLEEEDAPKVAKDPSPRIITPLSSQPTSTYRRKKKTQLAIAASTLIASTLTSNVKSESVFRPKRRPSKAPPTQEVFPPLKKSSSTSFKMHLSSLSSNQVSKFTSDFKFRLDSCEFPSSAILTSDESKLKKLRHLKKKIIDSRKRGSICKKNLESRKLEDLFNNKKGSKSFIKNLSSLDSFASHISSSILSSTAPIKNSKVNRFSSTSCTLSPFDSFSTSKNHFKSTSAFFNLPPNSSSSSSPTNEEETSSNHSSKEIKGPNKTLYSLHCKIILEKTLGTCKTFSLSHLGTSTCGKSKVKATNYLKSPSQTKPNRISNFTCYSRSSSGTRYYALFRLAYGEQPLYLIIIVTLMMLLLIYLYASKLLHLPFDRGKDSLIIALL